MDRDEALLIAADYVRNFGDDMVLVRDRTIEFRLGWAFFWENRRYLESGDSLYKAMGNVPFVVDRRTGQVTHVGPGSTDVVADYEEMVEKG